MIINKVLTENENQLGSVPADCMVIFDIYPEDGPPPHWPYDLDTDDEFYSEYESKSGGSTIVLYKTNNFPYKYIAVVEVPMVNDSIDIYSFEDMMTILLAEEINITSDIDSIFIPYKSLVKTLHLAYGEFKTILSRMLKALNKDIVITITNSL